MSATAESEKSNPIRERLIVQTAFLGDVLLSLPLLYRMRSEWPNDRLVVLVRKGVGSFLRDAGVADEVIEVDKRSAFSWSRTKSYLRSRKYELIVSPHESFRTALLVNGLCGKKKIGFRRFFNSFAFDIRVDRPMNLPESLRQLRLLEPVLPALKNELEKFAGLQAANGGQGPTKGVLLAPPLGMGMQVPRLLAIRDAFESGGDWKSLLSANVRSLVDELEIGRKPLIVLAPGSVWKTKMWTSDGYVDVAKNYISRGARVALLGAADESALTAKIASQSGATSVAGRTTLFESAELLSLAELLVCNDSGAMHLGATAGTPTVSIFGPTVLELGYRPWNPRARVIQMDLTCRPCGKHGAAKCPLGTHACMKGITAGEVMKVADELRRET